LTASARQRCAGHVAEHLPSRHECGARASACAMLGFWADIPVRRDSAINGQPRCPGRSSTIAAAVEMHTLPAVSGPRPAVRAPFENFPTADAH
jgi:hypothetical protein